MHVTLILSIIPICMLCKATYMPCPLRQNPSPLSTRWVCCSTLLMWPRLLLLCHLWLRRRGNYVRTFTGIYSLAEQQLKEWALLDTFDMLAPAYDNPQSVATVKKWFDETKLEDVQVFHWGHLVGRGHKS